MPVGGRKNRFNLSAIVRRNINLDPMMSEFLLKFWGQFTNGYQHSRNHG
jgi:hypothetical protein